MVDKTLPNYYFVPLQRSWPDDNTPGEIESTGVTKIPDSGELEI